MTDDVENYNKSWQTRKYMDKNRIKPDRKLKTQRKFRKVNQLLPILKIKNFFVQIQKNNKKFPFRMLVNIAKHITPICMHSLNFTFSIT
jgi:hypothetical protein